MGGHCRPTALTNVKMVDVSPCSPLTCVTLGVPSFTKQLIAPWAHFAHRFQSPDQIWSGDVLLRSSGTF